MFNIFNYNYKKLQSHFISTFYGGENNIETQKNRLLAFFMANAFLTRFIFVYSILIPIINRVNDAPIFVAFILICHEFSKSVADGFSGSFASKYSISSSVVLGLLLKCGGVAIWIANIYGLTMFGARIGDNFLFVLGMVMFGVGRSFMASKVDSFVYVSLANIGCENIFAKSAVAKTIFENSSAILGGIIAALTYKHFGFCAVLMCSIFVMLCIHVPLIIVCFRCVFAKFNGTNKADHTTHKTKKPSIFSISVDAVKFLNKNRSTMHALLCFASVCVCYFVFTDINKMVIQDMKHTADIAAKIYSIAHICPLIISIFWLVGIKKSFSVSYAMLTCICGCGFIFGASFFYNSFAIALIIAYLSIFPILKSSLLANLSSSCKSENLVVINSFAELMISFFNSIFFITIGVIAMFFSYKVALSVVSFAMFAVFVALFYAIFHSGFSKFCKRFAKLAKSVANVFIVSVLLASICDGFGHNFITKDSLALETKVLENGRTYKGELNKNGEPDGYGKTYQKDGKKVLYAGYWKNGKRDGAGKLYFSSSKLFFDGHFKDGKLNGYGEMYRRNGELVYKGIWKDNYPDVDESGNLKGVQGNRPMFNVEKRPEKDAENAKKQQL